MADYIDSTQYRALNGDFWLPFAVNFWFPFAANFWFPFAASCDEAVSMVSAASCPPGIFLQTHLEELTTFYVFKIWLHGNRCTNNFYGYNK